jgi:hypothetical protein
VRLSSRRRENERTERIDPDEYLRSIPPHLLPKAEGRSKGIMRKINHYCRRLAAARGTPWEVELCRLEQAAEACNTSTRAFFLAELYAKAHTSSSSLGKGAGLGKGKSRTSGSKGGHAGKSSGKGQNTSKDKDKRPKSRAEHPPTGEGPHHPDNIKKEKASTGKGKHNHKDKCN